MWFLSTIFIVVNKNLAENLQNEAACKLVLNLLPLVPGFRTKELPHGILLLVYIVSVHNSLKYYTLFVS